MDLHLLHAVSDAECNPQSLKWELKGTSKLRPAHHGSSIQLIISLCFLFD